MDMGMGMGMGMGVGLATRLLEDVVDPRRSLEQGHIRQLREDRVCDVIGPAGAACSKLDCWQHRRQPQQNAESLVDAGRDEGAVAHHLLMTLADAVADAVAMGRMAE